MSEGGITERRGVMKAIYQSIWVELPYMVVSITELRGSESLNAHAKIALAAVI